MWPEIAPPCDAFLEVLALLARLARGYGVQKHAVERCPRLPETWDKKVVMVVVVLLVVVVLAAVLLVGVLVEVAAFVAELLEMVVIVVVVVEEGGRCDNYHGKVLARGANKCRHNSLC